jgi:hypothetical protein
MPTASGVTIRTAGEAVGKFAAEMQKPVVLQWNDTMVTVKPNATGTQVEAAWKAAMRKQRK